MNVSTSNNGFISTHWNLLKSHIVISRLSKNSTILVIVYIYYEHYSETSVEFQRNKRRYLSEDGTPHKYDCGTLKSDFNALIW